MENEIKDKTPEEVRNGNRKTPMKTFVFDIRWHDAIQELSTFDRAEMYEAICRYAKSGQEPAPETYSDPCRRMALRIIFDSIDEQRKDFGDLKEM